MDEESGQVVEPERGSYTGSGSEGDDDDEEFDEGDYDGIDMTSIKVISTTNESENALEPEKELGEWVDYALSKLKEGVDFNDSVRRNHAFRNPAILEKMVAYCELDEHGTNLPKTSTFAGRDFSKDEYYKALAAEQRLIGEGRNMAIPPTSKITSKGKRTKWDSRG
uniref:Uncharacterized protein n=1 Tax=Rhodosorus marinus TaxID=101924 RepID=A0A7S2ZWX0_9RHOD|mmetsp:Transcript_35996/g.143915  ORF Transcript_35996/g.143915 Transcript_35996/m.143915 type:complete len:166 (+) Transcript_35996:2088-2585(+)